MDQDPIKEIKDMTRGYNELIDSLNKTSDLIFKRTKRSKGPILLAGHEVVEKSLLTQIANLESQLAAVRAERGLETTRYYAQYIE
jgi:hypothetical protein